MTQLGVHFTGVQGCALSRICLRGTPESRDVEVLPEDGQKNLLTSIYRILSVARGSDVGSTVVIDYLKLKLTSEQADRLSLALQAGTVYGVGVLDGGPTSWLLQRSDITHPEHAQHWLRGGAGAHRPITTQ